MNLRNNYKFTVAGCYFGYIVQGVILSFLPLLYVQLNGEFSISYDKISIIITITFLLQLLIDVFSTGFVTKLGYRKCLVASSTCALIGFIGLCFLPYHMDAFTGIIISVLFYSTGCGLIEVLISPLVEACPTKNKTAHMCLLHSFYCWGLLFTVLVSTAYFALFGIENWRWLALGWAVLPFMNVFIFLFCPIYTADEEGKTVPPKALVKNKTVWLVIALMFLGGCAEVSISQWMSVFVETGLNIPKDYCDLLGTCIFAACMGVSRVGFGLLSNKMRLERLLAAASFAAVIGYLMIGLSPYAWLSIAGCALCGFSTAVLWPATLSFGSKTIPEGGTSLFAFMALGGDLGCVIGPSAVGFIADGTSIQMGILSGVVFPLALFILFTVIIAKKSFFGKKDGGLPLDRPQ
ncbi:MAG: MFS transporter [Christensenellaceae bacterium]|nr:MFS transporter [Christensenellaceae bacterium]MDD6926669.1 MFS transporter [bacterium]MDY2850986.1 MFS transporter [Christensenellaceae bacterium]